MSRARQIAAIAGVAAAVSTATAQADKDFFERVTDSADAAEVRCAIGEGALYLDVDGAGVLLQEDTGTELFVRVDSRWTATSQTAIEIAVDLIDLEDRLQLLVERDADADPGSYVLRQVWTVQAGGARELVASDIACTASAPASAGG